MHEFERDAATLSFSSIAFSCFIYIGVCVCVVFFAVVPSIFCVINVAVVIFVVVAVVDDNDGMMMVFFGDE